jgi:hypothetical protein
MVSILLIREAQPLHVVHDVVYKLHTLLAGIGIVEANKQAAAVLLCKMLVQQSCLGVAYVQIPRGLRREPGHHSPLHCVRELYRQVGHPTRLDLFVRGLHAPSQSMHLSRTVAAPNIEPYCNIYCLFLLSLRFWRAPYMGETK